MVETPDTTLVTTSLFFIICSFWKKTPSDILHAVPKLLFLLWGATIDFVLHHIYLTASVTCYYSDYNFHETIKASNTIKKPGWQRTFFRVFDKVLLKISMIHLKGPFLKPLLKLLKLWMRGWRSDERLSSSVPLVSLWTLSATGKSSILRCGLVRDY